MNEKELKIYKILRGLLFGGAFIFAIWLSIRIIFPTQYFNFNFARPDAAKNTLTEARFPGGGFVESGRFSAGREVVFDAGTQGYFSKAQLEFYPPKDSTEKISGSVSLRKSFQAFLYPEGDPIGFPDGELLSEGDNLYFVSQGHLRRFASESLALQMGFQKEAFRKISRNDLKFNSFGEPILKTFDYPDGTVFRIGEDYFHLKKGEARKFISPGAFQTRFRENQAVFLDELPKNLTLSSESEGFAEGALLAYGTSVFIVNGREILPVGDATIFESKGFSWDDLLKVGGDEIAFYEKGKLFEMDSPHPDGTVFVTREDADYFLVLEGKIRPMLSSAVAESRIKKSPVLVSKESWEEKSLCQLEEAVNFWGKRKVFCELGAEKFNSLLGTDFEFSVIFDGDAKITSSEVILRKNKNKANFLSFWREMMGRIKRHYVGE